MAERRIRETAANSDNVILSDHALERMEQRGFVDIQVFDVLRSGVVIEAPTQTEYREWKCKIVKKLRGAREAGVVTIILHNGRLLVKTVEWEDGR